GAPGRITAHLDKQRAEVGIINIKVVVVHVDRLVARELKLPADLLALEGLRFLLRHTDEDNPIFYPALLPDLVGYVVLPLFQNVHSPDIRICCIGAARPRLSIALFDEAVLRRDPKVDIRYWGLISCHDTSV